PRHAPWSRQFMDSIIWLSFSSLVACAGEWRPPAGLHRGPRLSSRSGFRSGLGQEVSPPQLMGPEGSTARTPRQPSGLVGLLVGVGVGDVREWALPAVQEALHGGHEVLLSVVEGPPRAPRDGAAGSSALQGRRHGLPLLAVVRAHAAGSGEGLRGGECEGGVDLRSGEPRTGPPGPSAGWRWDQEWAGRYRPGVVLVAHSDVGAAGDFGAVPVLAEGLQTLRHWFPPDRGRGRGRRRATRRTPRGCRRGRSRGSSRGTPVPRRWRRGGRRHPRRRVPGGRRRR